MGGVLEVPVHLRNLTFFEQPFSFGASVLGYILLNDRAEAVRWNGDGLNIWLAIWAPVKPLKSAA